ncbi:MAG: hypothetical protein JW996_02555 [Candidatus Cloacimonetes bacterium]|nr:hypothetical protein [Candidatus Cloacimonadota bacterium]
MQKSRKRGFTAGIFLIVLGSLILFPLDINLSTIHFILGGLFLAGYFYKESYGLLIPGCLLISLSLSSVRSSFFGFQDFSAFWLGIGFIAIYVIDRIYRGDTHWWPLLPGIILILAESRNLHRLISVGWPVILIFVGIMMLARAFGLIKEKKHHSDPKQKSGDE